MSSGLSGIHRQQTLLMGSSASILYAQKQWMTHLMFWPDESFISLNENLYLVTNHLILFVKFFVLLPIYSLVSQNILLKYESKHQSLWNFIMLRYDVARHFKYLALKLKKEALTLLLKQTRLPVLHQQTCCHQDR